MSNIMIPSPVSGPEEVIGVVKNLGATTINEVSVSWQSYAGMVYDSTFTGLSLELLDGFEFNFGQMWVSPFGSHDVTMWINSVNGISDDNQENDTLTKTIERIAYSIPQKPCFEEFTSSTCGPCTSFNNSLYHGVKLTKMKLHW